MNNLFRLLSPVLTKKKNVCKDCVFFIQSVDKTNKNFFFYSDKCKRFIDYDEKMNFKLSSAYECRMNENKCGKEGKYFVNVCKR